MHEVGAIRDVITGINVIAKKNFLEITVQENYPLATFDKALKTRQKEIVFQ